jgi:hypothetical protein
MYYKNQWSAYCWDTKPLVTVPVTDVLAILKVNLELPEFGKDPKKKKIFYSSDKKTYKELFQFEVFNQVTDYPYAHETTDKIPEEADAIPKSTPDLDIDNMEGFKLWNKYEEDRRHKQNSPAKARKGYLMRPPKTDKVFKIHEPVKSHFSSAFTQLNKSKMTTHQESIQSSTSKKASPKKGSSNKDTAYHWVKEKNRSDLMDK